MSMLSALFSLAMAAPAPAAVAAAPLTPTALTPTASVEGINEYTLPNGLRVLTFVDESKPTATVNITYFVGSRHEDYGESGMAHLLEHLLFKGTPTTPNVAQALSEHGARANGTTWLDRTNYYETFPATDANVEWALKLEADRMINSFVAKKDLDTEMTVVRNEFEMGENNPGRVLMQRALSSAYLWHNYGNATIGARADLEAVPIERLQAFYRRYYQPDNAVLVIAGKFDEKKALSVVSNVYGKIPRPTRVLNTTYTREPAQDGERSVTLRRIGDVQSVLSVYHVPAGAHPDFAALDVLTGILGSTPSGRLYKALVEAKKATSVYGYGFQTREPGVLIFGAEVRKDQALDAARDALLKTVEELGKKPPNDVEVERSRAELLKDFDQTVNVSERLALQVSEWAAMGDWRLFFIHRDRIKAVKTADVTRVATTYLKGSNRTLGIYAPTDKPDRVDIPEVGDISQLVKDYKGAAAVAAGEVFDATPEAIEARTVRGSLKSGAKLVKLYKKTRAELVFLTLNLHLGNEKALMGKDLAGSLVPNMLLRGTKTKTREQLKDAFDQLRAQVNVRGDATKCTVTVEVEKKNLAATLALVREVLREPKFDAKEFELLRQAELAQLENAKSQPQALGAIQFQKHLSPWPKGHPYYVMGIDESLAGLKAAKAQDTAKFYADMYGAEAAELAVVGDFDDAAVGAFAAQALEGWKPKTKFERIRQVYKKAPAQVFDIATPDKANAFFMTGLQLELSDSDPDYPAVLLGNYMLGGGFLSSRLADLRQKQGTSYGVGSYVQAHPVDRVGTFTGYAIYAPENRDKVVLGFKTEIAKVLKDGFRPDEIKAAKAGLLESRKVQRGNDGQLASVLANNAFIDRSFAFDAALEAKLQALDDKTIVEAMRKHIVPADISEVRAGDFSKKQNGT